MDFPVLAGSVGDFRQPAVLPLLGAGLTCEADYYPVPFLKLSLVVAERGVVVAGQRCEIRCREADSLTHGADEFGVDDSFDGREWQVAKVAIEDRGLAVGTGVQIELGDPQATGFVRAPEPHIQRAGQAKVVEGDPAAVTDADSHNE